MRKWWQDLLAPFDFESTGVDTRSARAVSWCTGITNADGDATILSEIINPGVPIPPGSTEIHHITDEIAKAEGLPPAESLDRVAGHLAEMIAAKIPIVPFNGSYDFALLHWECLRHGVPTLPERTGGLVMPVIDTYVLDKHVHRYRSGKRKLTDVAAHYGVKLEKAHDAVADAVAAVQAARVIGSAYPEVGNMGPMRLHACQVEWRAEQQASLQHYIRFERKNPPPDPSAYVDQCWPVCLDPTHPTI